MQGSEDPQENLAAVSLQASQTVAEALSTHSGGGGQSVGLSYPDCTATHRSDQLQRPSVVGQPEKKLTSTLRGAGRVRVQTLL